MLQVEATGTEKVERRIHYTNRMLLQIERKEVQIIPEH
jgi:hypothetical protein